MNSLDTTPRTQSRLVFLIAFLAVGIPYWVVPYKEASLPSGLYGFGLILVFAGAMWLRGRAGVSFGRSLLAAGSAVPAAVLARVIVEVVGDPTSHNLWPIELVIAAGLGYAVAAVGCVVGAVMVRLGGR